MDVPSLAVFRVRLDGALSNFVWWKTSLPMAGELDWTVSEGPSQSEPFCDSVVHVHANTP